MAQLVSVSGQLTHALYQTRKFLDATGATHRNNDAARYVTTAEKLDKLTSAYLTAVAGTPLLGKPVVGPRFDAAAGTNLASHVTGCVEYLRETASGLVADPKKLSMYGSENTDEALGYLKGLYGRLMSAIEDEIVTDLRTLRNLGPVALMAAGETILATGQRAAKAAEKPTEATEATEPEPGSDQVVTGPGN